MNGRVVGKYRILDQLGEGGMGAVYRAEHVVLGSPAAVKVLLPQFTRDPVALARFLTEAKAASTIRHAGVTQVFDYGGRPGEQAFIAMELLRGESLTDFLARHGRLEPALAVEITMQLLAALDAAHVVGVVHRDLKPDNVFLVPDRGGRAGLRVKILDFGIAKLIGEPGEARGKTRGGSVLGTPAYMAPEQCRGGVELDARADLYAVGCLLHQLVAGRPPFEAAGDGELMAMHIYEAPPLLTQRVSGVPAELEAVVAKLLAKHPNDRAPSAAWALAALERISLPPLDGMEVALVTRPVTPVPPVPLVPGVAVVALQAWRPPRESLPRWIPLVVVVIALAIAVAAVLLIGGSGAELTPAR